MQARYVLHTAGPIWRSGRDEPALLRSCYQNSLQAAVWLGLRTIAFPAISCGVYGYPIDAAVEMALATTLRFLSGDTTLQKVYFVAFDERVADAFYQQTSTQDGKPTLF